MKSLIVILICVLIIVSTEAARKKKKNCHLKEVDKCFDKIEKETNNEKSAALIKTSEGLDKICR